MTRWLPASTEKTCPFGHVFWMSFRAPNLDNADPFFALVLKSGFYLRQVGVADVDQASGSL